MSALLMGGTWCTASESRAQSPMFLLDSEIDVSTAVYAVNQTIGQLTLLGSLDIMLGEATGLAADGPDVLYVCTLLGNIIRIDLQPMYSATVLGNVGGKLTQMQFHEGLLYVVAEDTDELSTVQISPLVKTVIGPITDGPMGPTLDIVGGDLTIDSAGNWFMFTNGTQKLYSLDVTTAVATEIGPVTWTSGRVTGLVVDYGDADKLYASARDLDQLLILNPMTGGVDNSINVCETCPGTFDLRAGDLGVPQATPTATATATGTATNTATATITSTATVTATATITSTATNTPLRQDGDPCTTPAQCQSMICADGVCCNEPCDGENESCDVPGREGECLPLTMSPAPTLSPGMMAAALAVLIGVAALALRMRRHT